MFHTLHRFQRDTILYPYLANFDMLQYSLPVSQPRRLPLFPRHFPPPSLSASAAALSLAPFRSIPAFYHNHIPTRAPAVLSVPSHRSIIYCVAMNFKTVFCLLQIYSSMALKPASSLTAAAEVYSHFLSFHLRRSLTVNRHATWYCNPKVLGPFWG